MVIRALIIGLLVCGVIGATILMAEPMSVAAESPVQEPTVAAKTPADSAKTHGDSSLWSLRCESDGKQCEIFQRLVVKKTNQLLMEMAFSLPSNGKLMMMAAVLPLESRLTPGVLVTTAKPQETVKLAYVTCNKTGCLATAAISEEMLEALKKSETMAVLYVDGQNKPTRADVSLKGFSEKLKRL